MASYFGEVIHPSSRAFWVDEDDEALDSNLDDVNFKIKWDKQEPNQIEKLLIIEGEMLTGFFTTTLLSDTESVCSIGSESEKNHSKLYLFNNVYICIVSSKLNLTQAGQFTETIAPLLTKSKKIYTLTSSHISSFKSEEDNLSSLLKCLHSNGAKNDEILNVSSLNQPNIVTGVCAGVLSYSEITNLHCVMYILYTDTFILDSKNILPLTELLLELLGKTFLNFTTKKSSFFDKGNLYM